MSKIYYSSMRKFRDQKEKRRPESGVAVYGYLVLLLSIAVMLTGYIWEYHEVLKLSEQMRQYRLVIKQLNENNHTMQVEIAALSTRTRIQRMASQKLGLVYPKPEYVVWHRNPGDRFKTFDTDNSFFAKAAWLEHFLSIRNLEANSINSKSEN